MRVIAVVAALAIAGVPVAADDKPRPKPPLDTRPKPPPRPPVLPDKKGKLIVRSTPSAAVIIDGVATGLRTPTERITLAAGKHKLTFVLDDGEKFTFAIVIRADETTTITKQLR